MFTKIKTFFLLLGYKIKELPLWDKLREIPRKTWIVLASVSAGVLTLIIGSLLIIPALVNGGGLLGGNGMVDGVGGLVEDAMGDVVYQDTITNIDLSSAPRKLRYHVGDMPEYSGLVILVHMGSFNTKVIYYDDDPTALEITGFDSSAPVDNQLITVKYNDFSTTFDITIEEIPPEKPTLSSISLSVNPKTEYKIGDVISTSGGRILCTYSNGETETIKLKIKHISGWNEEIANTVGTHTITVTVIDEKYGGSATTTYTITVTE